MKNILANESSEKTRELAQQQLFDIMSKRSTLKDVEYTNYMPNKNKATLERQKLLKKLSTDDLLTVVGYF